MEDTPDIDKAADSGVLLCAVGLVVVAAVTGSGGLLAPLIPEFCRSSMGVTGVENAGGGLRIGPESDIGDSITTSGGGVGGKMGEGRVIGWMTLPPFEDSIPEFV